MLRLSRSIGSRLANAHQHESAPLCAALDKTVQAFKDPCLTVDQPFRRSFAEERSPSPVNAEQARSASLRREIEKVLGRMPEKKPAKKQKKCLGCLQVKAISDFSEHCRARDGLKHKCRECHGQASELAPDVVMNTHRCSTCKEYLLFSNFARSRFTSNGLANYCWECDNIRNKEYHLRNRLRNATTRPTGSKSCSVCRRVRRVKAAEEFYKDYDTHDGLPPRCKGCFKKYEAAIIEYAMQNRMFTEETCMGCEEVTEMSELYKAWKLSTVT